MKKLAIAMVVIFVFVSGCGSLRFAPGEKQKQNAWLHHQTTQAAGQLARREAVSDELQQLSNLSKQQSRAFVSYYGLPKQLPEDGSVDAILSESSRQLADAALAEAGERPDGWELADSAMELAIAVAGMLGGVYGTRAVKFLRQSRVKAKALKEIVEGNEIFKKQNGQYAESFKQAQKNQSQQTRQVVAEIKA